MKNSHKVLFVVILILSALLWLKSCEGGSKEIIKVNVPEVSGELEEQKANYIKPPDTVYVTKWRTKDKVVELTTENPVNDSLALAYQNVKDSLDRYKLYLSAIQIRKFSNTFNDEFIDLTVEGEVQGELRYLKPTYTIKEREVEIKDPSKVTVFRLLAGAHLQTDVGTFEDLNYSFNLGLQNKKGNILRAGYSKMGGRDFVLVGYDFSLINIRK